MGCGIHAIRDAFQHTRSGLSNRPWFDSNLDTWLGVVQELDSSTRRLEPMWHSRNNLLAELGAQQDDFVRQVAGASERFGAHRIGLAMGTSTSSIGRSEQGYRHLDDSGCFTAEFRQPAVHNPHAPGAFVQQLLQISGPSCTISTACSSSAKAFATAARWLELDLADAVVVGGVDSLCQSVIYGFNSLQLIDSELCRPFDVQRGGINLGEAAGYVLLSREPLDDQGIRLLGYGESSDAYHMSSAHPEGLGAELAMQAAIERSGLQFEQLDYVNLHGTGTQANDEIESKVSHRLFAPRTRASSTKGWTGHTLGAAGICEAIIAIDAIATGTVPGNINTSEPLTNIAAHLQLTSSANPVRYAMSNSFGFGGNNCSLIFGAA
jgi:3-oxoacyl-[acyl-carrier-protein] synthase-1